MTANTTDDIILLADDDEDDVEIFEGIWAEINSAVRVVSFKNGLGVVQYLKAENTRPTVVFLDINMPEMNGWQCLQWMKQTPEFQMIQVVMYSTSSNHYDKVKAAQLGAVAFISKPSDYKSLRKLLQCVSEQLPDLSKLDLSLL